MLSPSLLVCATFAAAAAASASALAVREQLQDKPLHGRFIHITDIHPDPYYAPGSKVGEACHVEHNLHPSVGTSGVDASDPRKAGRWGTGPSDCDSPLSLMNITFDWLEKEWADKVDFVIWTGDNARHDISRSLPRTPNEIYNLNRMVARRMDGVFGKRGVKIVPSLGNNDIWPHNIMYPGPNAITENFLDIWSRYVPSEQTHVFERGAYFTSEVIPDKLAVISLNTLYWYDSNKAVDGCPFNGKEAGSEEMDWLEVQLSIFRARSMQVWLTGHVPPSPGNYFPDCWFRFGELALRFQDTIVGSMFGHMNVDHWFMMESSSLEQWRQDPGRYSLTSAAVAAASSTNSTASSKLASSLLSSYTSLSSFADLSPSSSSNAHALAAATVCDDPNLAIFKSRTRSGTLSGDLLRACERLPRKGKADLGDYAIVNVGPSVIPTYFPSVRVFTYNTTGEPFRQNQTIGSKGAFQFPDDALVADGEDDEDLNDLLDVASQQLLPSTDNDDLSLLKSKRRKKKGRKGKKKPHRPGDAWCRRKKHAAEPICQPRKTRFTDDKAPSRRNGFGTPLGYSQWFMPDINNKKDKPEYLLEYVTYHPSVLVPAPNVTHIGSFVPPIPLHLLPNTLLSALSSGPMTLSDKAAEALKHYTPYKMRDLTVDSYVRLGRQLAADKDLWKRFLNFMYVSTKKKE